MTGQERIAAAFSPEGTPEFGVVIPYEGLFIRDHWEQFTDHPWWYLLDAPLDHQVAWYRDYIQRTGLDWLAVPICHTKETRDTHTIVVSPDGKVVSVNTVTDERSELSHWQAAEDAPPNTEGHPPNWGPNTIDDIDQQAPSPDFKPTIMRETGQCDLADNLRTGIAAHLFRIQHVSSPWWCCYGLWGFEGVMTRSIDTPELVHYACQRMLEHSIHGARIAKMLGAQAIWIEECMTDMLSPEMFAAFNVPYLKKLIEEIQAMGMYSVYYFCGNPAGKWEAILSVGTDALALEEGKKGFNIDIVEVAELVNGKCVLLGNLDSIGVLEQGSPDELQAAINHQIKAGEKNKRRFVISLGSPVTPETPLARVQLYRELANTTQ